MVYPPAMSINVLLVLCGVPTSHLPMITLTVAPAGLLTEYAPVV
jgi:hypothetical protein